jgi:cytidine deaminase
MTDPITDSIDFKALVAAAMAVRRHAYAPYSRYHVGAALLTPSGEIFVGANVENAAYPQGACAETCAIGTMIASGARRLKAVAVIGSGPDLCTPCGGCRQRLFEFASAETPIAIAAADGTFEIVTLGALLPRAFGPNHLPLGHLPPDHLPDAPLA